MTKRENRGGEKPAYAGPSVWQWRGVLLFYSDGCGQPLEKGHQILELALGHLYVSSPVGVIAPAVTPAITSAADGASIAAEAVGEHLDRALRWTDDVALSIPDSQGDDHLRRAVGLDRCAAEE